MLEGLKSYCAGYRSRRLVIVVVVLEQLIGMRHSHVPLSGEQSRPLLDELMQIQGASNELETMDSLSGTYSPWRSDAELPSSQVLRNGEVERG